MQRSTQSFDKPGILSTLNIETRSQNEKKIIEAVSQIWFVTFSSPQALKTVSIIFSLQSLLGKLQNNFTSLVRYWS